MTTMTITATAANGDGTVTASVDVEVLDEGAIVGRALVGPGRRAGRARLAPADKQRPPIPGLTNESVAKAPVAVPPQTTQSVKSQMYARFTGGFR
jgi:hypothetical protein